MYNKFEGKSADEIHAMVTIERVQAQGFGKGTPAYERAKAALARVRAAERAAAKNAKKAAQAQPAAR